MNGKSGKHSVLLSVVAALLLALPAAAHHSFKAQYDENQPVTLHGTVTKLTWVNPHVHLFVDVADENGKSGNWEFELASPNGLLSQHWKVDSLKPGDQVTVSGYRARDGSNLARATKVTVDAR